MALPSMPRSSGCWALSLFDSTMFSPILSNGISVSAPEPSPLRRPAWFLRFFYDEANGHYEEDLILIPNGNREF
jgi:hypothetical protein